MHILWSNFQATECMYTDDFGHALKTKTFLIYDANYETMFEISWVLFTMSKICGTVYSLKEHGLFYTQTLLKAMKNNRKPHCK